MTVAAITDQQSWDAVVGALPSSHRLQRWAWGEVLAVLPAGAPAAGGQLLLLRLPAWRRAIAYLPRRPGREAAASLPGRHRRAKMCDRLGVRP
jgi:hypothetical protein